MFKSIKTKVIASFGIAIFIALLVLSLTSYYISKNIAQKLANEQLESLSKQSLNLLVSTMDNSIKNYLRGMAEKNKEIVELFYNKFKNGELTEEEAKKRAEEIILSQKVGNSGYVYIINSKGVFELHPKSKGKDVSTYQFIQSQIKDKEGYFEYKWKNPDETEERDKAAYMTYFKEWDYIISVSSYKSEFKELVNPLTFRDKLLSIKIGKTGYPYLINTKGEFLIHPSLEGKNYLDTKSADGKKFIKEMTDKKDGNVKYLWNDNGKERMKIAYFNYYKELDWIVVAGAYEDEFLAPLEKLKSSSIMWSVITIDKK